MGLSSQNFEGGDKKIRSSSSLLLSIEFGASMHYIKPYLKQTTTTNSKKRPMRCKYDNNYSYFTHKETETQRGYITHNFPKLQDWLPLRPLLDSSARFHHFLTPRPLHTIFLLFETLLPAILRGRLLYISLTLIEIVLI